MEYMTKVSFKDYLPNPLRNMAQLTQRRQLVTEIENSNVYAFDFPILDKNPNFERLWLKFKTIVDTRSFELYRDADIADFLSDWNQLKIEVDSRLSAFSSEELTTVPRNLMHQWKELYPKLKFLERVWDYESQVFIDYLNQVLTPSTNNLWEDFSDNMESVLDDYIHPHINTLGSLREITRDTDSQVVNLTARMLGFNFRDELLNAFGKDRIAAIIPMIGEFYEVANTDDFIKLIELVIGSKILMEHLYSKDYINFKTYEEMRSQRGQLLREDSGVNDWFKTTHVNLFVEYGNARYLAASINATLGATLLEIVEHFLPANVVLKNFGLMYAINTPETASGFFFASNMGPKTGYKTIQAGPAAVPPLIAPKLPTNAMIFESQGEIDYYLEKLNPTPRDIFDTWGRHAGANWYPSGSLAEGEALAWRYIQEENKIECSLDTLGTVGLFSASITQKYVFEATLSSTSTDDDWIGLTAAITHDGSTIKALHFIRSNYAANNWFASFQDGETLTRLVDGTKPLTAGYPNPNKNGWKESGATRVRIVREGNIVKGYTSKFGSLVIDPSTEILIDLNSTTRTRPLVGKRNYGYYANSQNAASFTDASIVGEFDDDKLYDITNDVKLQYDPINKVWVKTENYEFTDYVQAVNFFLNPITQVLYFVDGRKRIKRLSSYV